MIIYQIKYIYLRVPCKAKEMSSMIVEKLIRPVTCLQYDAGEPWRTQMYFRLELMKEVT